MPPRDRRPDLRRRDERGQATVLIIGFAVLIAMVVALVVDTSAGSCSRRDPRCKPPGWRRSALPRAVRRV